MLTKEEALDRYGDVPCKFSTYYKYHFSFVGTAEDGATIYLGFGGSSDDIYKFDVSADVPRTMKNGLSEVTIKNKDKEVIYEEHDSW